VAADRVDVWLAVPTQAQDGGEYLLAHPAKVANVAPLLNCVLAHGDDDGGGVGVNLPFKRTSCSPFLSAASLQGFNDQGVDECWFLNCHESSISEIELNARIIFSFLAFPLHDIGDILPVDLFDPADSHGDLTVLRSESLGNLGRDYGVAVRLSDP